METDSNPGFVPVDPARSSADGSEPRFNSGSSKRLTRARTTFLTIAGVTGAGAPWLLGGEPVAAEWALLVGAALTAATGFGVRALCVRTHSGRSAWKLEQVCLAGGAVLLTLMLVQALNPAFRVEVRGATWQLLQLRPIPWLPQSIADPFDGGGESLPVFRNAWRYLLIFGISWLYVAGLAAGFRERNNAQSWVRILGAGGALLAIVSIVHSLMGSKLPLWVFGTQNGEPAGAVFLHRSQESAYLAAVLALACGLAATERTAWGRRVWEGVALVLWVAAAVTGSLIAVATGTVALLIYWQVRRAVLRRSGWEPAVWRAWILGAAVTAVTVGLILVAGEWQPPQLKPQPVADQTWWNAKKSDGRVHAMKREVGLAMWVDRPFTGWGGGAYANLFDVYSRKVVSMAAHLHGLKPNEARPNGSGAQCDPIEFLVDYGVFGLLLLLGIFGVHLHGWIYWRGWKNPLAFFLIFASLGALVHASFDSILRSPALLLMFSGLPVAAVRLAAPSKGKKPGRSLRKPRPEAKSEEDDGEENESETDT